MPTWYKTAIYAEKNIIVGNTCNANIYPNFSVLNISPTKNDVPAFVKSNILVTKSFNTLKAAYPGSHIRISSPNIIYIAIPIPTNFQSILFLFSDTK